MNHGSKAAALTPVPSATRREVVINALRRALLTGELQPGQRIKEVALADALGVSRPTVREAINQLVTEGSLVQIHYRGISVPELTAQDVLDVAEVRVSLETLAALQVAKDPDGEAMDRLRAALAAHLKALSEDDPVETDVTHLTLHRTLWEGAHNTMLHRIWPLVESQVRLTMSLDQVVRSDPARDADLHRRLVAVIESGVEEDIVAEVRRHIVASADEMVRLTH